MAFFKFRKLSQILVICTIAFVVFLITLDIQVLNPTQTNWLFSGDPAGVYLGWVFYRNSPWSLPLGLIEKYGISLDASLVYTDSIPIMAIFFKLFDEYLPTPFQYFGYWYALLLIGQSYFGWKLANLITTNFFIQIIVTLFFTFSPAMLAIFGYWPAEASHFLFLAAIYLILIKNKKDYIPWACLLILTVSICFYIFLTIAGLWFGSLLDKLLVRKTIKLKSFLLAFILTTILVFLVAWQVGYFTMLSSGVNISIKSIGNYGYGMPSYSFDILSPFYYSNWSLVLKGIPESFAPKYSFNYLGLGLIVGSIFLFLNLKIAFDFLKKFIVNNIFVTTALFLFLLIGITNVIRFGPFILSIPIPEGLYSILSVVRASNRLVWPLYYFYIFGVLLIICKVYPLKRVYLILFPLIMLQIIDTSPGWLKLREISGAKSPPFFTEDLKDPFWDYPELKKYKNIMRIPFEGIKDDQGAWEIFGHYAGKKNMGLNVVALARENQSKKSFTNNILDGYIKTGTYDQNSLYIIDDSHLLPVLRHINQNNDLLVNIDGFNVLIPNFRECKACEASLESKRILKRDIPVPILNEPFYFNKNGVGSYYLLGIGQSEISGMGWSYPEDWGVWTDGTKAMLNIPYPINSNPKSLLLTLKAFVPESLKYRSASLYINNNFVKDIKITSSIETLEINLPQTSNKDYVYIEFRFTNPMSPKQLGISQDERKVVLGLISAKFNYN